jgi:hypothetical protein
MWRGVTTWRRCPTLPIRSSVAVVFSTIVSAYLTARSFRGKAARPRFAGNKACYFIAVRTVYDTWWMPTSMAWRFALLVTFAVRSWACACSGNWPSVKQAWRAAPVVFLGTVALATPDGDSRQLMFQEQSVRIRVEEAFKGVFAGQMIELHQGADDCSGKFRTGQTAVFYLYPGTTQGWIVPACTHAVGSAEPLGDDLLFLRGFPISARGTRLSGAVDVYEDSPQEAFRRVGGLPNVRVRISGLQEPDREVMTNANGVYELYGLPPGRYSVKIKVPKGLKIKFPIVTGSAPVKGNDSAVELNKDGGASVDFVLQADTKLSGRILDAKGSPIKDVCIDLEPLEGRGENGALFFDCSKAGGAFKMEMMPPGKYRLVARDEVTLDRLKSKSTLYYPGVRYREQSTTFSVEAGKYLDHLDIRSPSDENRYKLQGWFQFADGAPVAGATVTFTSPKNGYVETTESHADGSFGLSVVAGVEGQLMGHICVIEPILRRCAEFRVEPRRSGLFRFMDASSVPVLADSDHKDLKLVLASPSCKAWPVSGK